MPRLSIRIAMTDDENRTLVSHAWAPLSYEDFNNPALLDHSDGSLVNQTERDLLERIRTAIDRSLLRFSRGERRRFETRAARPDLTDISFSENYDIDEPRDVPLGIISAIQASRANIADPQYMHILTEAERMAVIGKVIPKEDEPLLKPEPKRLNRYQRKPVI
jgi:hypothetical protein